jgi:hypothetical protein
MQQEQTTSDNTQYLLNQQVSFTQNFLSGMDAGEYQLNVSQQVLDSAGKPVSGDPYSNTYTFAVAGDRFSIARPADVVHSTFPMDNASGEYSNVLPHVLFRSETFPWIRFPNAQPPDQSGDVPTWLWLMILDEDDVAAYPSLSAAITTRTIGDLFPPAAAPTSSLGSNYSYFQGATGITALEPGQNTASPINTIDVPLALIWKIAPTIADLQQMAHGRTVSLINQPANARTATGTPTGTFSIVFGNRLPQSNKRTAAFLVSLEQMESFLPDSPAGGAPAGNTYDGSKNLRLAVLSNWTFTSMGQPATFVHKLQSLNGCTPGGPPASNTNLRLGYAGSNPVVGAALNMGYVPLNETMRTSEQTVSWYRGPLVPYNVTQASIDLPVASPDAAMIFDPATGMLDVSYAAAWTAGRMIALQDTAFSVSLYNWKRSVAQQVISSSESRLMEQTFGQALGLTRAAQKNTLLQSSFTSLFSRTVQSLAPDTNPNE